MQGLLQFATSAALQASVQLVEGLELTGMVKGAFGLSSNYCTFLKVFLICFTLTESKRIYLLPDLHLRGRFRAKT